jgi:hypothetical protein
LAAVRGLAVVADRTVLRDFAALVPGFAAVRDFAVVLGLATVRDFAVVLGLAAGLGLAAVRGLATAVGFAAARVRVPVAAGAAEIVIAAPVSALAADDMALVAAAAIWVADEATFTAAEDTVLAAAPVVRMLFAPVAAPRTGRAAVAFALVLGFRLLAAFLAALPRIALVRAVAADLRLTALRAWVCTGIDLPP